MDSFESNSDVLLICATNRKEDLDKAVLSRMDLSVSFELPDERSRSAIFQRYAKQLKPEDIRTLARMSEGFSGRNINDICKGIIALSHVSIIFCLDAERRWASKLIRQEVKERLPTLEQYIESLTRKMEQNIA